jgi:hypothetical protein
MSACRSRNNRRGHRRTTGLGSFDKRSALIAANFSGGFPPQAQPAFKMSRTQIRQGQIRPWDFLCINPLIWLPGINSDYVLRMHHFHAWSLWPSTR